MLTHRTRLTPCPDCGKENDAATPVNGDAAAPRPGDLTVCWNCTAFLTFTEDLGQRLMTAEEIVDLDAETRSTLVKLREWAKARRDSC